MDTGTLLSVLKWSATILAAGFIAHFGKQLAETVIAKIGGKKATPGRAAAPPEDSAGFMDDQKIKRDKKRDKAMAKTTKKSGKK